MDTWFSSPCSDPNPTELNYLWANPAEPSRIVSQSDEDVVLASDQPKRKAGRKKFNETRHPVYRGIRQRNTNRWVCELREPNKKTRIWLGTYPTAEMAARAHDVAALALRGPQACLNFADSVWRLPVPASKEAKDIRKAAAEAAESFRPREEPVIDSVGFCRGDMEAMMQYMDEEEMFDMPGLIANMAEGMLLLPPHCLGVDDDDYGYNMEDGGDMSLWSYSM